MTKRKARLAGSELNEVDDAADRAVGIAAQHVPDPKNPDGDFVPAAAPEQTELPEQPVAPDPVQNGRMAITFHAPRFYMVKDDKLLDLDVAMRLSDSHAGILPKEIERVWEFMRPGTETGRKIADIPCPDLVVARFFLGSDSKKTLLELEGASITKATLAHVVETGRGREVHYIRFSFALTTVRHARAIDFATSSDGADFWLEMYTPQGKL